MNRNSLPQAVDALSSLSINKVHKRKIDLLALRYMAQQLRLTLHTMEQPLTDKLPVLYAAAERRCCAHRIALYDPQQLMQNKPLAFVGFVSGRWADSDVAVSHELYHADAQMLAALAHIPGLLSYSSLEIRPGRWYNLVVLQNVSGKAHLKSIKMHQYAAYELAPRAYDWIRIHSGLIPAGLAGNAMDILGTKHYVYEHTDNTVLMCEVTYEESDSLIWC